MDNESQEKAAETAEAAKPAPVGEAVVEEAPAEKVQVGAEDASAEAAGSVEQTSAAPEAEEAVSQEDKNSDLPWYVVHTYSGFESRVKLGLEERIRSEGVQEKFGKIVVPEENVVELVRGEKKTSKKKFFPGYILVQCLLDSEAWHLVKDTPKVTGFVGDSVDPVPLSEEEVATLLKQMEGGATSTRATIDFEAGDAVKVIDGPFADFNGTVDDVKPDKGKLRVLISIFGRNTPVELDFVQVEKV